jgi:hypothetical protein
LGEVIAVDCQIHMKQVYYVNGQNTQYFCVFLYCNHQAHRDILRALYNTHPAINLETSALIFQSFFYEDLLKSNCQTRTLALGQPPCY